MRFGQRSRVHADFQPGNQHNVTVRWSREQPFALPKPTRGPRIETRSLTPDSPGYVFIASRNMALMQLSLRTMGDPTNVVRRLSITPVND